MLNRNLVVNKFYTYAGTIVKLKKISKSQNIIIVERLDNGENISLPYQQNELILYRIYTVGEVSKLVEKRADTIRKYEKKSLIPTAQKFGEKYKGYSNWRFYSEEDVYLMVEFFNSRTPGRPTGYNKNKINTKVKDLAQKVQTTMKEENVRSK